ncbi:MAG: hypothetical protein KGJ35_03680, partial [Patescibacteria group bacterium]|nr:hypothetical protein [Patescibacteria group bacterium]
EDGKGSIFARPVVVFKKFNKKIFWGIPLTLQSKNGKFYSKIELLDGVLRMAILSQMRLLDSRRLYYKIGIIDENNYKNLIEDITKLCRGP